MTDRSNGPWDHTYADGIAWIGLWNSQATPDAHRAEYDVLVAFRAGWRPNVVGEWDDYASIWECVVTDDWNPVECATRAQRRTMKPQPSADPKPATKRRPARRKPRWPVVA